MTVAQCHKCQSGKELWLCKQMPLAHHHHKEYHSIYLRYFLRLFMSALLVGNREGAIVHNWPPCHLPTQCPFWLAKTKDDGSAHLLKAKVWFISLVFDLRGDRICSQLCLVEDSLACVLGNMLSCDYC